MTYLLVLSIAALAFACSVLARQLRRTRTVWRTRVRRAEERASLRAQQHERMADAFPGIYWEVAAPGRTDPTGKPIGWSILCSLGAGLATFGLTPREVEGQDVRPWLEPHEIARYEALFAGERDHDEYEKRIEADHAPTPTTGDQSPASIGSRWTVTLHTFLDARRDGDGRVCGISAVSVPISERVREEVRAEVMHESIGTLSSFFRTRG